MKHFLGTAGLIVVLLAAVPAYSDWTVDGNGVCTEVDLQMNPVVISDGANGAIVAWQDRRDGSSFDIFVQRMDATGAALWTPGGVAVCVEGGDQSDPRLAPDGAGGVIVTWEDARSATNFDVYAQRVDAAGVPQWTANGVQVCVLNFNQHNPAIAPIGSGGAVVVWQDHRDGQPDIYAQFVNADGDSVLMANGVGVCTATRAQQTPLVVSDGGDGAIVCWVDRRAGLGDIYVQGLDAAGTALWSADGLALCADPEDQALPTMVRARLGAYVAWADKRNGTWDIYANFVDPSGNILAENGVAICTATGDQSNPSATVLIPVIQGAVSSAVCTVGPAFIAWDDKRADEGDIYARLFDCVGNLGSQVDGIALCTAPLAQVKPVITSDPAYMSNPVAVWQDQRANFQTDIYAQQVSVDGVVGWDANGVKVCGADGYQYDPVIVFAGAGTPIAAWEDLRSGTYDIYAQFVMGAPNAVAITSFDASARAGVVTLRAAFRSNLSVESVNVYRTLGIGELRRIETVAGNFSDGFEYVDESALPGQTYRYQIGVVDADGEFFSAVATVTIAKTSAALHQNRPNPFNPSTTIWYDVPERGYVSLSIFDASGRHIRTLASRIDGAGRHSVLWDGRDDSGVPQSSGVYFYQLRIGNQVESKKMVLLK